MKKVLSLTLAVLLIATMAIGCGKEVPTEQTTVEAGATQGTTGIGKEPAEKTTVKVGAIQGPTGIGMVHLMEANKNGAAANEYKFTVSSVPQDIGAQLVSGNLDIAAVPTNLAASLYQKTSGKVQLLAVNTLGVLYMLDNGNGIASVEDLKGKTIYSTGEGANPEYILRYVLQKNGIDPDKDVKIEFLAENTELVAKMVKGDITLAMVPEPNVSSITSQNQAVKVALSMNTEWEAVAGAGNKLMMGCVAVRKEFAKANKAAVDAFLTEYKASIEKTSNVELTATLCEANGIIPKAALAKKAIPNCQLTFVSGADMKAQIAGYYQVLFDADPKAIGGKLPDDAFYYAG